MRAKDIELDMGVWYPERQGSPDFRIEPGIVEEIVISNKCSYVKMRHPSNNLKTAIRKSTDEVFRTRRQAIDYIIKQYEKQIDVIENKILNWEKQRRK
jgi:hypothetical protein